MKVTGTQTAATVDPTTLDLSGPIDGGYYTLTEIGGSAFWTSYNKSAANIETLILPSSGLTTIGDSAFRAMSKLSHVEPFLPESVISVGGSAFYGTASLVQELVLGADAGSFSLGGSAFYGSALTGVTFKRNVTAIPNASYGAFGGQKGNKISTITILADDFYFGQQAFNNGLASTVSVYVAGNIPTFDSRSPFPVSSYKRRFIVPYGNQQWLDEIANHCNACNMTTYHNNFPDYADYNEPSGVTISGTSLTGAGIVIVVRDPEVLPTKQLYIAGAPANLGTAAPAYDIYSDVTSQMPLDCSVSQYGAQGNVLYESYGYQIERLVDNEFVVRDFGLTNGVIYSVNQSGIERLKWLFRPAGYKYDVLGTGPNSGSATFSTPDLENEFFSSNSTFTVTATPIEGATFERWYGDIPAGHEKNNPLTLTADGEKKIIAYFKRDWLLKDNKITNGYWTWNVSVDGDEVTITSRSVAPEDVTILDLSTPIKDESNNTYRLVSLYENGYTSFCQNLDVTELYLPQTLRWIGYQNFKCENLAIVEPLLPNSVTNLGNGAFNGVSKIGGSLTLGGSDGPFVFTGDSQFYSPNEGSYLTELICGRGVTNIPSQCFWKHHRMTNIVFRAKHIDLANNAFRMCTAVKKVTFGGSATWVESNGSFWGWTSKQACFIYPGGNASWEAFVNDPTKVTLWKDLDPKPAFDPAEYGVDVTHPTGITVGTVTCAPQWVIATKSGTMFLVK